jgi:hypothetical protein
MTLDQIRDDILTRRDAAQDRIDSALAERNIAVSELVAHDRAVAAMGNGAAANPARAPRRDIGALVREALTDQPQAVAQIAEKVGVPPSRVEPALAKVGAYGSGGWTLRAAAP